MIEIKIPKEINKFETKLIGPFTSRQVVCVAIGGILCLAAYNLTAPFLGTEAASALCFILATPCAVCGWYKPYGMHAEVFFKNVIFSSFLTPAKRKYKTKNYYEEFIQAEEAPNNKSNKKKYKKSKKAYK